ncbi:MAG: type II toxin-antitoxin system RelE/ParE family toxin [Candidatus Competibacteraceae bacterium]|nr:type II toxin-antitoxin system RelE/ParE family toxin [Candidatus Competibacteraceae bacterium]
MPEYRFTPEAENDLQQIIDYTLEQWGKAQARDYVDGLEVLAG